jgi:hypothetical protein
VRIDAFPKSYIIQTKGVIFRCGNLGAKYVCPRCAGKQSRLAFLGQNVVNLYIIKNTRVKLKNRARAKPVKPVYPRCTRNRRG